MREDFVESVFIYLQQAFYLMENYLGGLFGGLMMLLLNVQIHFGNEFVVGNLSWMVSVYNVHQVIYLIIGESKPKSYPAFSEFSFWDYSISVLIKKSKCPS